LSIVLGRFQQSAAVPPTDNSPGAGVTQLVTPNAPQTVVYGRVKLEFPAGAVFAPTNITITPLGLSDVHALDTAMTNVTPAPQVACWCWPAGSRLVRPITIGMPYDASLIPMGLSEQDLFTYYFDVSTNHWRPLQRVKVDAVAQVVVSLSDHFTDMINSPVT